MEQVSNDWFSNSCNSKYKFCNRLLLLLFGVACCAPLEQHLGISVEDPFIPCRPSPGPEGALFVAHSLVFVLTFPSLPPRKEPSLWKSSLLSHWNPRVFFWLSQHFLVGLEEPRFPNTSILGVFFLSQTVPVHMEEPDFLFSHLFPCVPVQLDGEPFPRAADPSCLVSDMI